MSGRRMRKRLQWLGDSGEKAIDEAIAKLIKKAEGNGKNTLK